MPALIGIFVVAGALAFGLWPAQPERDAAVSPSPAFADVVLNPGTVKGAAGIPGWTQTSTYVSISGNSNGYNASGSKSGTSYEVTIEGGQSYSSVYVSMYKSASGKSQNLAISKSSANLSVPGGGTVTYDMTYPGGFIQPTLSLTGGKLVSSRFYASLSTTGLSSNGNSYASGAAIESVPMIAVTNVSMYSSEATVDVFDTDGVTVLCQTKIRLPNKTGLTVSNGATTTVPFSLSLSPANCARGVEGKVELKNLPSGTTVSQTYIYSNGTIYRNTYLNSNPGTYSLDGLANGDYRPYAQFYMNGMSLRTAYYGTEPATVTDTSGMVTRDFVVTAEQVTGKVLLSGPSSPYINSISVNLQGVWGSYNSTTKTYGPTAGAYANCQADKASGAFTCLGFTGDWQWQSTSLSFYDGQSTNKLNASMTVSKATDFSIAQSAVSLGDKEIPTSVSITPLDENGQPSSVDLTFGTVTGGGSTTVSFADVGPAAPEGYEFVDVVTDKQYLNVTSSAQFSGQVQVCLTYDPVKLGLTASQESALVLQQYVCTSATECSWKVITGTLDGSTTPDTTKKTICGVTSSLSTFAITLPTDACPNDPNKTEAGTCGCGTPDTDSDNDGTPDCKECEGVTCTIRPGCFGAPPATASSSSAAPSSYQATAELGPGTSGQTLKWPVFSVETSAPVSASRGRLPTARQSPSPACSGPPIHRRGSVWMS